MILCTVTRSQGIFLSSTGFTLCVRQPYIIISFDIKLQYTYQYILIYFVLFIKILLVNVLGKRACMYVCVMKCSVFFVQYRSARRRQIPLHWPKQQVALLLLLLLLCRWSVGAASLPTCFTPLGYSILYIYPDSDLFNSHLSQYI